MRSGFLKTPITYYGGKLNMVDLLLPKLDYTKKQFVSLFTGGAAVEIAKRRHDVEVWNDIDNRLITFWEVVSDKEMFYKLQERIKKTVHAEAYHKESQKILKRIKKEKWRQGEEDRVINGISKLDVAWATWVQTNMSFSNIIFGGFAFANDNSRNLKSMNQRDKFEIDIHERIKLVQIFNRDAIDLLKLKDTKDTFFFIDPPYLSSDQGHYKGTFSEYKFREMCELLGKCKGTFLMTTYHEKFLDDYIERFGWIFDAKSYALFVDGKRKDKKTKKECIITNYQIQGDLFKQDLFC